MLDHPRYRSGELLGRGAQGFVLRVIDREAPSRPLVAKVWTPGAFSAELLAGEFALLARLRAPGLVRAHDFSRDQTTGAPFLVEDFVEGVEVKDWFNDFDAFERSRRLSQVLGALARTLAALHDAGFVHGDVKPAHVRVRPDGRVILLDLGASVSRTSSGSIDGPRALTPAYAAPELMAGARPTPESDLYSLGALAWTLATGSPPEAVRPRLRARAAWLLPPLAQLLETLLSPHPADRPHGARAVLSALGAIDRDSGFDRDRAPEHVEAASTLRRRELATLMRPHAGVRYVRGAPGMGKSVLLRELVAEVLLSGRDARLLRFPLSDPELVLRLIAFFRGANDALPFRSLGHQPLLLALDDLEKAPAELTAALDAFRCRSRDPLDVVAALRSTPEGAEALELGPLQAGDLTLLCRELGVEDPERETELLRGCDGSPIWLIAAVGQGQLSREGALARARALSEPARQLLALLAVVAAETPEELCRELAGERVEAALAELSAGGLLVRRGGSPQATYAIANPLLAPALADALAEFSVVDRVATLLLERPASRAELLFAVASAPHPPSRRTELLRRAAERAEIEGLRSVQIEALLALAADPKERTLSVLSALDRLTRGGGSAGLHPEVVGWLEEAAGRSPALRVLSLRRRAEQSARAGRADEAQRLGALAREAARTEGDPTAVALAHSTLGALALYRADWAAAEDELTKAHGMFASGKVADAEETARHHHNRGVVALYRGRVEEARSAFEQSLATKRELGDRGGVWACLLNLGLALTKLERFDEADAVLAEGLALARSLEQRAGAAWCLAALADAALRRGDPRAAERRIAEAEHLASALPAAVRADLAILRAQVALLEGDGTAALTALAGVPEELKKSDALIDARALIARAKSFLVSLPSDRRSAARCAIRAARRARDAGLPEPLSEAISVLAAARGKAERSTTAVARAPARYDEAMRGTLELWALVERLAGGAEIGDFGLELAKLVLRETDAERAFVALLSPAGTVDAAWGVDLDGLPISDATQRLPVELCASALERGAPLYQPSIETRAGTGSRLIAAAGGGGVIVVEHRFLPARFDGVSADSARHWATLASLLGRMTASDSKPTGAVSTASLPGSPPAPEDRTREPTTALPARVRHRKFHALIGSSAALERALARLDAAIDSDLPALIVGETGVGKELFARALHDHGARAAKPFVAVSCGAIPESLFEAELFGHARGAFTGADRARQGLLARADGGTLFLDEIGELPLLRQAALLRALATRSYRPVGSDEERRFDIRVVAATNRDLERAVAEGQFRSDLLYRLNVLELEVPPLRERGADVALLARHFLASSGSEAEFTSAALRVLEAYGWPGNVRELEHQIQRLAALRLARVEPHHLSREVREGAKLRARAPAVRRPAPVLRVARGTDDEREQVRRALDRSGGNITRAAAQLGLTRQGLKKRMLRLGMRERAAEDRPRDRAARAKDRGR